MDLMAIMVQSRLVTVEQKEEILENMPQSDLPLERYVISKGYVNETDMLKVMSYYYRTQYVNLSQFTINTEAVQKVSERVARQHALIPISFTEDEEPKLIVAMADPSNYIALDDVKIVSKMSVVPYVTFRDDIEKYIDQYYSQEDAAKQAATEIEGFETEIEEVEEDLAIKNAPVVRLIDSIVSQAIKTRVSDIHIEPFEKVVRVRFRIDGTLVENMQLKASAHSAIATRIKIMSGLDIAERRIPQDGRIETTIDGREVDMRVSVLPTVFGEKIVIRILNRNATLLSKEQLGFSPANEKIFDEILKAPEGIILLTGPTGSGKTTTLYTALRELNDVGKNIITVEDPVEYRLEGVNQVQVNTKAGLTFASGLRSILRQDPDIVLLGEIRDEETASIAVRAAITGHVVLSTIHTNDTASTVNRLVDMGIKPYLVSTATVGIIAQRLIKRICPKCKTPVEVTSDQYAGVGIHKGDTLYHGVGCNYCSGTGYYGRIAIHEIMAVTKEIKALINQGGTTADIRERARQNGMRDLAEEAIDVAKQGITTIEEAMKIAFSLEGEV
ncbi:GspE/PulE family protein [Streptococcus oricebi]|uniref:Type II secretion system protein GspE n=1 Tax=Streptococcus oricebi TaxID=1547447 RepID=A0ABS5B5R0_9STRE|nr:GspE/PulE family protein [Streptococcus oricebi]MBP2624178.1 type II secretion system protein GspE [Streptococcus oricebi]